MNQLIHDFVAMKVMNQINIENCNQYRLNKINFNINLMKKKRGIKDNLKILYLPESIGEKKKQINL